MKPRFFIAPFLFITAASFAADAPQTPKIPAQSIAKKGGLLFSDDFEGTERDKRWHKVVPTFAFENGTLKGTQTRDTLVPAADGKPEVKPHAAVFGLELPTKNSVIETKIRFDGASVIDVEFDDRKFTGSHYGHLCRAQIRLNGVSIVDERDGSQSNAMVELRKDGEKNKKEMGKLYSTHAASFPAKLEAGKWYTLVVETVGDEMRVTIDGKPAAFFKSPGIGHETKSKIEVGVSGKDGFFDDFKVWDATAAK